MDSLQSFWDAVVAFGEAVGSVAPGPLALALALWLAHMGARSAGWRRILIAALPGTPMRQRWCFGSVAIGSGLNGILPARIGDVLKLFLMHQRVPGASYPLLAASLIVETVFNAVVAVLLLVWALQLGALPSFRLPDIPAFELSFIAAHPDWSGSVIIGLLGVLAAAAILYRPRMAILWAQVADGLAVLRQPRRYLREVAPWQAAAWGLRAGSVYFFLDAFGVTASVRNALIVMMVQAVASALPLTPGGAGPKQALLVVLLVGEAPAATLLAFSVGMEIAIVAFQILVALGAASVMLRGTPLRGAVAQARAERAATAARSRAP